MHWQDEGIVLAARPHGETALIVQLLTRAHGRHAGLVRGGQGPKLRGVYQVGNRLAVTWRARLSEHLGTVVGETQRGHWVELMDDAPRLACLMAAAALAETTLPEREPHPRLHDGLRSLLEALAADSGWGVLYVAWEMALLDELGFGLDLTRCAATGRTEELVYVSPKSGQAVCATAGAPYRDRLLALPAFLRPGEPAVAASAADLLDGLRLTDYFLRHRVLAPHRHKVPAARSRFFDLMERMATISGG